MKIMAVVGGISVAIAAIAAIVAISTAYWKIAAVVMGISVAIAAIVTIVAIFTAYWKSAAIVGGISAFIVVVVAACMKIIAIVGGISVAIVAIAAVYALTMFFYYRVRRKFAHCRYAVEIVTISVVAALSFIVRMAALIYGGAVAFGDSLGDALHAIYMVIGGFTFEGLEEVSNLPLWGEILYYGGTLYAGLVALSVITVRISYEMFSIVGYAAGLFRKKRRDVFIFTAVTEDALLLAASIEQKYKEKPDAQAKVPVVGIAGKKGGIPFAKKRDCCIMFAGNELEPFDHKNELHRTVMSRGYYYISYGKHNNKKKEPSLIRKLHLAVANDPANKSVKKKGWHDVRRHVFAVRQGKALTGEEASNSDFVFDDIRSTLSELSDKKLQCAWREGVAAAQKGQRKSGAAGRGRSVSEKKEDRKAFMDEFMRGVMSVVGETPVVDYHILTDDEINYEFYATELDRILKDSFSKRLYSAFDASPARVNGLCEQYRSLSAAAAKAQYNEAEARLEKANIEYEKAETKYRGCEENLRDKLKNDLRACRDKQMQAKKEADIRREEKAAFDRLGEVTEQEKKEWFIDQVVKELLARVRRCFQLHIFNEALLSARDFSLRRIESYRREDEFLARQRGWSSAAKLPWGESLLRHDVAFRTSDPDEERFVYRAVVLGFGKTAQCAMNALFVQTSAVDEQDRPSQFIADVYDRTADERSGLFAYTHPLYQCFNLKDCRPKGAGALKSDALLLDDTAHQVLYDSYREGKSIAPSEAEAREQVNEQMGFPRICFHKVSCFDLDFMRMLDDKIDAKLDADGPLVKNDVRAFIICLGTDEANIRMANALIDDFKHEAYAADSKASASGDGSGPSASGGGSEPLLQTIYVHIRDEKNSHRLNWTQEDEEFFRRRNRRLVVVRFGNRETLYSYDGLLEERPAERFHYVYDRFSKGIEPEGSPPKWVEQMTGLLEKTLVHYNDGLDFYKNAVESIFKNICDELCNSEEPHKLWLDIDAYLKQSNESVSLFEVVYEGLLLQNGLKMNDLRRFVCLEKVRWNRFYMSNGWVFGKPNDTVPKKMRRRGKEHDGLSLFEMLPTNYKLYDAVNVLFGYFSHYFNQKDKDSAEGKKTVER